VFHILGRWQAGRTGL